jgi:hypothetical protein
MRPSIEGNDDGRSSSARSDAGHQASASRHRDADQANRTHVDRQGQDLPLRTQTPRDQAVGGVSPVRNVPIPVGEPTSEWRGHLRETADRPEQLSFRIALRRDLPRAEIQVLSERARSVAKLSRAGVSWAERPAASLLGQPSRLLRCCSGTARPQPRDGAGRAGGREFRCQSLSLSLSLSRRG